MAYNESVKFLDRKTVLLICLILAVQTVLFFTSDLDAGQRVYNERTLHVTGQW